jgi:hypothetical protein
MDSEKQVYRRTVQKKTVEPPSREVTPYYSAIAVAPSPLEKPQLPKLVIMRGIPGSGKTKYCKLCLPNFARVSSDDYFTDKDGIYTFVPSEMFKSHDWCYNHVLTLLSAGKNVVVDNVFSKLRDFKRYLDLPLKFEGRIYHIVAHHGNTKNIPIRIVKQFEATYESHALDMRVELILYTDNTWKTQNYGYEKTLGPERLKEIDAATKTRNGSKHSS